MTTPVSTVRLWDVDTGAVIHALRHTDDVNSVSFSPNGNTIASGSRDTVRLWNVRTGAHIRTLTGHTGGVNSVAFSPDGNKIASVSPGDYPAVGCRHGGTHTLLRWLWQ